MYPSNVINKLFSGLYRGCQL